MTRIELDVDVGRAASLREAAARGEFADALATLAGTPAVLAQMMEDGDRLHDALRALEPKWRWADTLAVMLQIASTTIAVAQTMAEGADRENDEGTSDGGAPAGN